MTENLSTLWFSMYFDCTWKKKKHSTYFWPWISGSQKEMYKSWQQQRGQLKNWGILGCEFSGFKSVWNQFHYQIDKSFCPSHPLSRLLSFCFESTSCAAVGMENYNFHCLPFITSPNFSSGLPDPHKQVQHYHRNMLTASWTICVQAFCLRTTLLSQHLLSNVAICSHSKPWVH